MPRTSYGAKKLLFLGSSRTYPKRAPQPMKEEHLLTGELEASNELQAVAKMAGSMACQRYNRQYGTDYVAVMPTNLYGVRARYFYVVLAYPCLGVPQNDRPSMSDQRYRQDIDGLRAIAVLSVVFYHLRLGPLHGGFVGVDVFFVISGFLITGIIQREIGEGEFSYATFYERRVRRIFPALFVLLTATTIVGAIVLLPTELRTLGMSLPPTLFFGSNFYFWRNSGYFNSAAELNPVLQTWSLSVEEQFYIGLPILLLLVHRFGRHRLKAVLWLVALTSFGLCLFYQRSRPTATFFLAPFRAWELMLGALLTVGTVPSITRRDTREAISALSLACVLGSIALIEPGPTFPGWRAAIPAIGTAGLLHAGASGDSVTRRFLCLRPLSWVGLISYSLYLWHWPVIVYAKLIFGLEPLAGIRWILLGVAVALGASSYRLVERPFRKRVPGQGPWKALRWGAVGTFALAGVGALLIRTDGWRGRFPARVVQLDRERNPPIPFRECIDQGMRAIRERNVCQVGALSEPPQILVWGDSHSLAWIPALDAVFRHTGVSALFIGRSACPPLVGVVNPTCFDCLPHNHEVLAILRERRSIRLVVMAASWLSYSAPNGQYRIEDSSGAVGNGIVFPGALARTVALLRNDGRAVWILGPVPGAPGNTPLLMAMAGRFGRPNSLPAPTGAPSFRKAADYFYRAAASLPADQSVTVTDPTPWFCDAATCRYQTNGLPLYRDGGHLNVRGAAAVRPALEAAFIRVQRHLLLSQVARP